MTKAEERALEAVPPRYRKSKNGLTKIDSALPVRKFYIRAYEQAEKDLALTWEDIQRIVEIADDILLDPQRPRRLSTTKEAYYTEILKSYMEEKK